jgi:Xaa-Pro dipeptidase
LKRGLLSAFLTLVAVGMCTAYLYLRIEYGSVAMFREAVQRRWALAAESGSSLRYQAFRTHILPGIQQELRRRNLDGWLLFDHRRSNPHVYELLPLAWDRESATKSAIPMEGQRDFFQPFLYFIPAANDPFKLVHPIDAGLLQGLPGREIYYLNRQEWDQGLQKNLAAAKKVAIEDAASSWTASLLRESGIETVSSEDLVQFFLARLPPTQLEQHRRAAHRLSELIPLAFAEIKSQMDSDRRLTIGQIKQFLLLQMDRVALRTESIPIVSTGINTARPYFSPPSLNDILIREGDVLLIEVAARMDEPASVYAKVAWTGFVGTAVPPEVEQTFAACAGARNAVLQAIRAALRENRVITGREAQQIADRFLIAQGPGSSCPHPVGYSLGKTLFGPGTNLDDVAQPDARPLISGTAFSIEPGVYGSHFGVRSAISVYLSEGELEVTTLPVQERVTAILQ